MGVDRGTHIGIYLELPHIKTTVVEKFYVSPTTGKKQKNRFDENTGVENILKTQNVEQYIEPMSYITDDDSLGEDEFWTPAYSGGGKRIQTFLLNARTKYNKSFDDTDVFNYDLASVDIPKLIEDFKQEYKPYLEYYTNKGYEYEVKFGVVNYAH